MKNLKDFTIGNSCAEQEPSLSDYFYETHIFKRLINKQVEIVVGNRGLGKSALFNVLAEREELKGSIVEKITPYEYIYELLKQYNELGITNDWARIDIYSFILKYILLTTVAKRLYLAYSVIEPKNIDCKILKTFLLNNDNLMEKSFFHSFWEYLKRFRNIKQVSLSGVQFESTLKNVKIQTEFKKIENVIEPIRRLTKKKNVIILFDELDTGWDFSEESKQFIAALLKSSIQINREFENIRILVSMRSEIYWHIPEIYFETQDIKDSIEHIFWSPDDLRNLILTRLKYAIKRHKVLVENKCENELDRIWNSLFVKYLSEVNKSSLEYIISISLSNPRTIIRIVNDCLRINEKSSSSNLIDYPKIDTVLKHTSLHRTKEIIAEFKYAYPNIEVVIDSFKSSKIIWAKKDLNKHLVNFINNYGKELNWKNNHPIVNPLNMLEMLIEVGFFQSDVKLHNKGAIPNNINNQQTIQIDKVHNFKIHPIFCHCLGLGN